MSRRRVLGARSGVLVTFAGAKMDRRGPFTPQIRPTQVTPGVSTEPTPQMVVIVDPLVQLPTPRARRIGSAHPHVSSSTSVSSSSGSVPMMTVHLTGSHPSRPLLNVRGVKEFTGARRVPVGVKVVVTFHFDATVPAEETVARRARHFVATAILGDCVVAGRALLRGRHLFHEKATNRDLGSAFTTLSGGLRGYRDGGGGAGGGGWKVITIDRGMDHTSVKETTAGKKTQKKVDIGTET
jgi:hypothetical protein